MGKKVEPPVEAGAPAYMLQYSALMTLLLAFFICIVSTCKFAGEAKVGFSAGVGRISNSLGVKGGFGILPFMNQVQKNYRAIFPKTKKKPKDATKPADPDRNLIGLPRNSARMGVAELENYFKIEQQFRGVSIRLNTPILFGNEQRSLDSKAVEFVQRVGGILQSMPDVVLTVRSYSGSLGDEAMDEELAAERGACVLRHLETESGVERVRMRVVAYNNERYLGDLTQAQKRQKQAMLLYLQKDVKRMNAITANQ